jgi:acyl-CoA synthetase (AMP-forming)/AMP-acid ligase II
MLREVDKDLKFEENKFRNKVAIIDYHDNPLGIPRSITFRQLSFYNSSVARKLLSSGYKEGDRIAIVGLNSFKFVAVYLGARLAGMTPVVINHKLSKSQIEHVINHSESKLVFHDDEFLSLLPDSIDKVNFNKFDRWVEFRTEVMRYEYDGERLALMLYTSGSTGSPKCVAIKTKNRIWGVKSLTGYPVTARSILAQPLSHINGLNALEASLMNKSSIVITPKFSVESYRHAIFDSNVSRVVAIPPMMAMLLEDEKNMHDMKHSNVKLVTLSGAPTSEGLYDRIAKAFPQAVVRVAYGMSEIGPGVFTIHKTLPTPKLSVGIQRDDLQYKMIDDVLWIKTPGLFSGYYKDSEKTRSVYDDDGFFNTRDKFRIDENGFYFFIGRADDMFVSGGENIYPGEVEEILNSHPCVRESCVISLEDDIKGTKAYAFVIMDGEATEKEIMDYYATHGPAYQIPRRIWPLERFPLTHISKVDKRELVELAKKLLEDSEEQ